ncbi:MAG: response regulator transcription factor, partial [Streptosporangiaceae bacterium]
IAAQRSGGAAAEVPLGCLARLQRALGAQDTGPDAGPGNVTAVPGLVEQLTSRELEVLQMLATGMSNPAIAGQLVVTLDTVKKHVSHVLGKLGAANRTEAVTRARARPDPLTRSDSSRALPAGRAHAPPSFGKEILGGVHLADGLIEPVRDEDDGQPSVDGGRASASRR